MNNTTDDRTIQRYLDGDLPPEERREFESLLATDTELQREVKEYERLQKAVLFQKRRIAWDKIQQLESQSADNTISIERKTKKTNWLPWMVAASIFFLLVAGLSIWNQRTFTPQELVVQNFSPYPNTFVKEVRGEKGSLKLEAFKAYDRKDYEQAISYFEQYVNDSTDAVSTFFLGNAYLATNNYKEAITTFRTYLMKYEAFSEEAHWYLVLAYIGANQIEQANEFLNANQEDLGIHYDRATEMMGILKNE